MDDELNGLIEVENKGVLIRSEAAHAGKIIRQNVQESWQIRRNVAQTIDRPLKRSRQKRR